MTRQIRQGDTVLFDRKRCTVIRITDCCAVLQVPHPLFFMQRSETSDHLLFRGMRLGR